MLRPAVLVVAAALFAACGGTPTPPPPTRVEISSHPAEHQPPARDAHNPFRRADRDPPPPRSEPQLPPAELDKVLAAAAAARAAGDDVELTQALLPCANKIPKSTRCEGELALVLAKSPGHKAESDYYLKHAIADDDPAADADFYGRLAEALRIAPMLPEAAVALQRRIARLPEPTAADWAALAEVLQGVPRREAEAAEALQRAFERDPSQLKYLRDAGELLSQVPGEVRKRSSSSSAIATRSAPPNPTPCRRWSGGSRRCAPRPASPPRVRRLRRARVRSQAPRSNRRQSRQRPRGKAPSLTSHRAMCDP
ncbi:hypothetical protein [Nannocystis pusilla]|uniref:hypothetical protein n=1 Tax=Nannocystis pusilla TaxID=889268 RepID=UPI003B821459